MKARGWFFLLMFLLAFFHKPILRAFFILDYREKIIAYSRENGINPAMISAIVFTESRFDSVAKSHKGALGLMQIMPATGKWVAEQMGWKDFSPNDLLNPERNLKAGTWYLAYLWRLFNQNENLALASYNAGSSYVLKWVQEGVWYGDLIKLEQIPFPETKKYLLKIVFFKNIYRYLYPELTF